MGQLTCPDARGLCGDRSELGTTLSVEPGFGYRSICLRQDRVFWSTTSIND